MFPGSPCSLPWVPLPNLHPVQRAEGTLSLHHSKGGMKDCAGGGRGYSAIQGRPHTCRAFWEVPESINPARAQGHQERGCREQKERVAMTLVGPDHTGEWALGDQPGMRAGTPGCVPRAHPRGSKVEPLHHPDEGAARPRPVPSGQALPACPTGGPRGGLAKEEGSRVSVIK